MAQSGTLDPSFGAHGIVKTDMGSLYNYNSYTRQVLVKPDGSIYIICNYPTFISKRFPNGSIDSSYGVSGYSRAISYNDGYAAFQPDGKIVIVGLDYKSGGIARINTNGTIDSTFGKYGIQNTAFTPSSVSVKTDGKIVVTGGNNTGFIVAQFNTNGSVDNTFNGNGQTVANFVFKIPPDRGGTDSIVIPTGTATTVTVQTDGKILVGGYVQTGASGIDFAIARFNSNGSLDNSFNNDGEQTTSFGSGNDFPYSIALQSDGKIILAGYTSSVTTNYNFALVRYKVNGSLDSSFNGNGKRTADVGGLYTTLGNSVAIQKNGKIVVGGYTLNGANNDFAVARFNLNGNTDNSFGNSGIVVTDINNSDNYAGSVVIQVDDKILLAGYSDSATIQRFALTRYHVNGTLDNSFGNDGKLEGNYKQGHTEFNASVLQPDGKLLVAGSAWNGIDNDFAIARYNSNGSPDKTFGNNGQQITDLGATDEAVSIALQPDGKIVVAGRSGDNYGLYQFAAARYTADGILDNTFNGNGKLLLSSLGKQDLCSSVALQRDGKIVLIGFTYIGNGSNDSRFAIARLNSDGSLDNTFSDDGKQVTDFDDAECFATSVAIQNDGKIVVAGRIFLNNRDNFALARYNTDGSLDLSFSQDGKQNNVFGTDNYFAESMSLQKDGKIVLAGFSETIGGSSSSFLVARYNVDGTLDNTFNTLGFQTTSAGSSFNFSISVAIKDDGRIALGGTNDNFTMVLYKTNGSLDSSFGENGIKISGVAVFGSRIQSILFDQAKLYAIGYGQYPGTLGVIARYLLSEAGPLPVTLLDFKAFLKNNNTVVLQWQTVDENNVSGFTVQRSNDATNFTSIGYVASKGNSSSTRNYTTFDKQPLPGVNFYRLQMVDEAGNFTFSKIVSVKIEQEIFTFQISPNPAKDILSVRVNGENEKGVFQISDAGGRKLKEVIVSFYNNKSFTIDISSLPRGIYNLQLFTKSKIETKRFVKE